MDKALILERLELLDNLCEKTEPDVPSERHLFTEHSISVHSMISEIRDLTTGVKTIDPDSERDLIINVMRESNKIWRLRNKVKNGDFDDLANLEMNETIEDFVAQGAKKTLLNIIDKKCKINLKKQLVYEKQKTMLILYIMI